MAAETAHLRTLARRVKQLALEEAEFILSNKNKVSSELYNETFLKVLNNAIPRTQEITGEDGGELKISFDPVFKKDDPTPEAEGNSTEPSAVQGGQGGA